MRKVLPPDRLTWAVLRVQDGLHRSATCSVWIRFAQIVDCIGHFVANLFRRIPLYPKRPSSGRPRKNHAKYDNLGAYKCHLSIRVFLEGKWETSIKAWGNKGVGTPSIGVHCRRNLVAMSKNYWLNSPEISIFSFVWDWSRGGLSSILSMVP